MEKNEFNLTTESLCNLWTAVFKEVNNNYTEDQYTDALVEFMADIEKILVLKLQNESPNIAKILAIITEFGQAKPMQAIATLLKAHSPNITDDNVHHINKAA